MSSYSAGSPPTAPMDIKPSRARSSSDKAQSMPRSSYPDEAAFHHTRTNSSGSIESADGFKKLSTSPTVNVYTHCGRHSSQWLFSGWGKIKGANKRSQTK